jgi:hypothetical protein
VASRHLRTLSICFGADAALPARRGAGILAFSLRRLRPSAVTLSVSVHMSEGELVGHRPRHGVHMMRRARVAPQRVGDPAALSIAVE